MQLHQARIKEDEMIEHTNDEDDNRSEGREIINNNRVDDHEIGTTVHLLSEKLASECRLVVKPVKLCMSKD